MQFRDTLTLDAPKRTRDGYLAVRAKAARTGVYQYAGREIDPDNAHGLRDKAIVNVLRDEQTVFDTVAAQSFIGKPVTDDHPSVSVNASNWRDYARGTVMGAMREGQYLAFDLLLTDESVIRKVDAGKRELSNGYGAELEFGSFTAADGTLCDARQSKITGGNHVALVDRGRAGSECAIKDGFAVCDAITASELERLKATLTDQKEPVMAGTIIVDGLPVSLADEAAVRAVIAKKDAAIDAGQKALTDAQAAHDKAMAAKDAEIDDLKGKVVDQAQIDALADAKADVVSKAKAVCGDKLGDTAGKTVADVRRMAVAAKLGDERVKDKSDDYVAATFDHMTADVKPVDPVRQALSDSGGLRLVTDASSIHAAARAARAR
jgi:uncharacterized protein